MKKIRSEKELLDCIDEEYSWRFKEISDIKLLLKAQKTGSKLIEPYARCLVVLSYSHWEGFVKYSSEYFFRYVIFLGLNKSQLSERFLASCIQHLSDGMKAADAADEIYKCILDPSYKFSFNSKILTSAESNLNFDVLTKISTNMGLDVSSLFSKRNALDSIVLARRNDVAHGNRVCVDIVYGEEVASHVQNLMLQFKNLLQNMISSKEYRK